MSLGGSAARVLTGQSLECLTDTKHALNRPQCRKSPSRLSAVRACAFVGSLSRDLSRPPAKTHLQIRAHLRNVMYSSASLSCGVNSIKAAGSLRHRRVSSRR